jgi:hypothetical protein
LLVSWLTPPRKRELVRGAEVIGEILALLTWIAFRANIAGRLQGFSFPILLYAVLSLTGRRST